MSNPNVGMMYPVWAPLNSHTDGSMPTYGTGRVIMEARNATVTYTRNTNAFYGDDRIVDDDDSITEMTIQFTPTGMSDDDRKAILGEEARSTDGGQWVTDGNGPYGGFGYIRVMRYDRVRKFEAWITLKIKFHEDSQTTNTKESTIQWNPPQLTGRAAAIDVDGGTTLKYQLHKSFDSMSAAKAFINGLLNVPSATST